MAIYTKRGDTGETSLYDRGGAQRIRVSKDSLRIKAIGSIDELNSLLGVCIAVSKQSKLLPRYGQPLADKSKTEDVLEEIQRDLFTIGSILAGSDLRFSISKTNKLEKIIDEFEGKLPVLKNFILPGGSLLGGYLHLGRTVARRAERGVVSLSLSLRNQKEFKNKRVISESVLPYLNRLSDFLFMLARYTNISSGEKEKIWKR